MQRWHDRATRTQMLKYKYIGITPPMGMFHLGHPTKARRKNQDDSKNLYAKVKR